VVVRHPVLLGLAPPGGVQAQQAGGDDAQLEEDHGSTGSDDDRPGGAHNLSVLVIPTDEDSAIIGPQPGVPEAVNLGPRVHKDLLIESIISVNNFLAKV